MKYQTRAEFDAASQDRIARQNLTALRRQIARAYRLDLVSVSQFRGYGDRDFAAIVCYSEEERMHAYEVLATPGCPFEATYETNSRIFIQMCKKD